jgi:hypothetical protein
MQQDDAQVAVDIILEINQYFDNTMAQSGSQEDIPNNEELNICLTTADGKQCSICG